MRLDVMPPGRDPWSLYASGALLGLFLLAGLASYVARKVAATVRARRAVVPVDEALVDGAPVVELPRAADREHEAFVDGHRCKACGERASKPMVRVVAREFLGALHVTVAAPMPLEDPMLCADHWRGALERAKRFVHAIEVRAIARSRRIHRDVVEFNQATIDALVREGKHAAVPFAKRGATR